MVTALLSNKLLLDLRWLQLLSTTRRKKEERVEGMARGRSKQVARKRSQQRSRGKLDTRQ